MSWLDYACSCSRQNVFVHATVQSPDHHELILQRVSKWAEWLPMTPFLADCLRRMNMTRIPPPILSDPMPMFYQVDPHPHKKLVAPIPSSTKVILSTYAPVFHHGVNEILGIIVKERTPEWAQTVRRLRPVSPMETVNPQWKYTIVWSDYMVTIYQDIVTTVFKPWSKDHLTGTGSSLLLRYLLIMIYERSGQFEYNLEPQMYMHRMQQVNNPVQRGIMYSAAGAEDMMNEAKAMLKFQRAKLAKLVVLWLAELLAEVYQPCFPDTFQYLTPDKPYDSEITLRVLNTPINKTGYAANRLKTLWARWKNPGHTKFYPSRRAFVPASESIRTFMLDVVTRHCKIKGHIMFSSDHPGSATSAQIDIQTFVFMMMNYKMGTEMLHMPIDHYLVEAKYAELAGHLWNPTLGTILCVSADQRQQFSRVGMPEWKTIT